MKVARIRSAVILGLAIALGAGAARAQSGPGGMREEPGTPTGERPNVLRQVTFDQKLDAQVPGDLLFRDETGKAVQLKEYFGTRPLVLALVYYECPMLCTQVLSGLASALDILTLDVGKDFDVVAVSFNPKEGPGLAKARKQGVTDRYKRPGTEDGWHFLSGPPESIAQLTKAVGFNYVWDEATKQFAHAAGVMVLTPDGRVSKYFYGVEYSPRDLRFGLVEASAGRVGTPVDSLLLYCYHYDPTTGTYGLMAMRAVQAGGLVLIAGMLTFWVVQWRRERRSAPLADAVRRA